MGLFTKTSQKEAKERAKWAAEHDLEAHEAIQAYKKKRADKESVRKVLAQHDDYFKYVD